MGNISSTIPVAQMDAINAELETLGFGPCNFSIPLRTGTTDATHAGLHCWDIPDFRAALETLQATYLDLRLTEGDGRPNLDEHMATNALTKWEQPEGAHDPYAKGERVTVGGKTWESLIDYNVWPPGVAASETTVGGPLTVSGLPNGAFTIGASANGNGDARMFAHRAILIPRLLTAQEKADLDGWLSHGYPRCAALGDSTVAAGKITGGLLADTRPVTGFMWDAEFGFADVSKIGDKIADQKTLWTAIADKSKLEAVFIQIGLNDIKTYIGGNTKTSAQVIADLQDLVGTVRAAAPSGCKVYICGLTPCKGWLDAATNPTAAYAGWQAVNDAIAGNGATPVTGVDGRITSHVTDLNDGSGNLAAEFDTAGDHVHPNNWGRWKVAGAWRAQLVADGLI